MEQYVPEGLRKTPTHGEALRRAMETGEILEAQVSRCDEYHDLTVALDGGAKGIIPREETALGVTEGTVGEMAILSRVGKSVCFRVMACRDNGSFLLSRRSAQESARNFFFRTLRPGDLLPAVCQSVSDFGVFCDIGCGVTALLGKNRISVSRAKDPRERFAPGQQLFAAVERLDPLRQWIYLTHRELLGTWTENAARFAPEQTVTGIVRSIQPYGIFVELTPNLTALAEPREGIRAGDGVSVYIKSICPEREKMKLVILEKLPAPLPCAFEYVMTAGHLDCWQYSRIRGGGLYTDFFTSSQ